MIEQWMADDHDDASWLMHAANYLLRTRGTRWAIDPYHLKQRLPEAPQPNLADLKPLNFVLLTHAHADHMDRDVWRALRDEPIRWVVPRFMLDHFLEATERTGEQWTNRLLVPTPGETLVMDGLKITPFDGLHWEWAADAPADSPPRHGIAAMGYLVESDKKRWLFPGDTRTYDRSRLPDFGPVDIVFAHVWLGRGSALLAKPPELESFCRFVVALSPRERIVLAHLNETSRPAVDCWMDSHASQVTMLLQQHLPDIQIQAPRYWERFTI